jgi:hypothetical protein
MPALAQPGPEEQDASFLHLASNFLPEIWASNQTVSFHTQTPQSAFLPGQIIHPLLASKVILKVERQLPQSSPAQSHSCKYPPDLIHSAVARSA